MDDDELVDIYEIDEMQQLIIEIEVMVVVDEAVVDECELVEHLYDEVVVDEHDYSDQDYHEIDEYDEVVFLHFDEYDDQIDEYEILKIEIIHLDDYIDDEVVHNEEVDEFMHEVAETEHVV